MMKSSSTLFHVLECGPLPPTSTSHPPDVIHVIGVPMPFTLFVLKNKKWGRPWNEARGLTAKMYKLSLRVTFLLVTSSMNNTLTLYPRRAHAHKTSRVPNVFREKWRSMRKEQVPR